MKLLFITFQNIFIIDKLLITCIISYKLMKQEIVKEGRDVQINEEI